MRKTIKVRTTESIERVLIPGDLVTFSYKAVLIRKDRTKIEVIGQLQFENVDGVLVAEGPLRIAEGVEANGTR